MTKLRPLIAGNWKMNGLKASLGELAAIGHGAGDIWRTADLLICPPATLVARAAALGSGIPIGGQDCHAEATGAFTGDVSAEMLKDAGATAVIVVGRWEHRLRHRHGRNLPRCTRFAPLNRASAVNFKVRNAAPSSQ